MGKTTGKTLASTTTKPLLLAVRQTNTSDNYDVEILGLDLIAEQVLAAEVLLIMELVGTDACADNYNVDE